MVCPRCGHVAQRGAESCVNISCAAYQVPFTAEQRDANRPRRPVPTAPMRPLRGTANATIACVAVVALSAAVAIPLGRLGDTAPLTPVWATVDLLIGTVAAIGAACFVTWLFRARRNLDALPNANPFWAKSWTVGVWFVPAGNFAMPALIAADIAQETVAADRADPRRSRIAALATSWWISVIVTLFLLYVVADRGGSAALDVPAGTGLIPLPAAARHPASAGLVSVTVACLLVSAVTCVMFVRGLTSLQERRFTPQPDHEPAPVAHKI